MKYFVRARTAIFVLVASSVFGLNIFAEDWRTGEEPNEAVSGETIYYAEVSGNLGSVFSVSCDDRGIIVELISDDIFKKDDEVIIASFGVDRRRAHTLRSVVSPIYETSKILTFLDVQGAPLPAAKKLLPEVKAGRMLFLVEDDGDKIIEEFSLSGSTKAISFVEDKCK